MKKTTIRVGHNGLRLDVHSDHVALRNGWRPGIRINPGDLPHLLGLLTVASGGGLRELVATDEVLSGRTIDGQRDGQ
jgi:hypothetical protein